MKIIKEFWHQEIIVMDLPIIAEHVEDFNAFYDTFLTAIHKAKRNPLRPGWSLRHDLIGWREYKFFSKNNPNPQEKPDMRFVYHYDKAPKYFYVLAVGLRNSKETRYSKEQHSVYYMAAERLKKITPAYWQMIQH
ncbi:hypothetical protein [Lentibacillus juripiscarius]|uniref:Uncharacterized protein n=1 Tax=Lentibacillus juripiscarius TaxID=257446 RepID=A0ABW5V2R8_9BACI